MGTEKPHLTFLTEVNILPDVDDSPPGLVRQTAMLKVSITH